MPRKLCTPKLIKARQAPPKLGKAPVTVSPDRGLFPQLQTLLRCRRGACDRGAEAEPGIHGGPGLRNETKVHGTRHSRIQYDVYSKTTDSTVV